MSKYEKYKESGVEWIGEVPEHWVVKRLKNLATNISSKSTEILDDDFIVALENIESNTGKFIESSSEYENNGIIFKESQILYNKLRPYLNKVYLAKRDGICVGDIIVVECSKILYPKFLQYKMLSDAFCAIVMSSVQGTKMPRTSWEFISSLKFGIPPKAEQLAIANYLDHQTQKIDRLIANKKAQAEKLKELRHIEINNAVTKGLNPNAEMKHSGIVWLGKIPKHWEVRKIKQLLKPEKNAIKTGPFGSDLKFEDLIEEGIKVYNQRSVLDNDWESGEGYISEKKYETLKTCTIFPDDMVITTRGTIGKVSIFPLNAELGILHPCLMRIQMNSQRILNDYLKIIINDSSFFFEALKLASNATTIDVIYSESLKEVKIPVPPVQEQIEITSYLKERIASTDKLSYNIQTQIEKLQELRKIKIYEAVTGKIKVNAYV
ncbi:MAG: restriction endonuclease subunit S [Saprospiraceae bacterium]|nr:restriction endonuclease subunit S [Saprospiraceae bacterium]